MNAFDYLEKLAKNIIEGSFERLFRPQFQPANLLSWLAEAMEAGKTKDDQGHCVAPNDYQVILNPKDYQLWLQRPNFAQEIVTLQRDLLNLMAETQSVTRGAIIIHLAVKETIAPAHFQVLAKQTALISPSSDELPQTKKLPR